MGNWEFYTSVTCSIVPHPKTKFTAVVIFEFSLLYIRNYSIKM